MVRKVSKTYQALGGTTAGTADRLYFGGIALMATAGRRNLPELIALLQDARELAPIDPSMANDLAALLLEQASWQDSPRSLLAAIEVLELALAVNPTPELAFNRALALQKLHLPTAAQDAWERFLKLDPNSPWAFEAMEHLDQLETRLGESLPREQMQEAMAKGSAEIRRVTQRFPGTARAVGLFDTLGAWGRAYLSGQQEASKLLEAAHALGEVLAESGGDQSLLDTVLMIESTSSPALLTRLAGGHNDLADAQTLLELASEDLAQPLIDQASLAFEGTGSPSAVWVEIARATALLQGHRLSAAAIAFGELTRSRTAMIYPAARGQVYAGLGLVRYRQGLFDESFTALGEATKALEVAKEGTGLAVALGLTATTLSTIGNTESAWRERYRALALLASMPGAEIGQGMQWGALEDAAIAGFLATAQLISKENSDLGMGESLERAAKVLSRRPWLARLLEDSDEGRKATAPSTGGLEGVFETAAFKMLTVLTEKRYFLQWVERLWGVRRSPAQASRREMVVFQARSLLNLALDSLEKGHGEAAERDLWAALGLFEASRQELRRGRSRREYSATWRYVFDELVHLGLLQGRPAFARRVFETGLGMPPDAPEPSTESLPAGLTVLEIATHPDFLVVWRLSERGWQYTREFVPGRVRRQLVERFVDAAASKTSTWGEIHEAGRGLAELLALRGLTGQSRLCLVTHQELAGIPFAALPNPDSGRPLAESVVLTRADSLAGCVSETLARRTLDTRPKSGTLLLVQPPATDLPSAKEEVTDLELLYPEAVALSGAVATRGALLEQLPRARSLHYAGHVIADTRRPELSFLPLAGERGQSNLTAEEIEELTLPNLDLAVLAGCTTFTHRPDRPESLSGLGRAFLDAGAKAVLGTLWDVNDRATRTFMQHFYWNLRDHEDPAAALAMAQRRMLASTDPGFSSPSSWAGFVLMHTGPNNASRSGQLPSLSRWVDEDPGFAPLPQLLPF
ncbi:MAG TPA: CHAT domain-containing protein [Thermoanaerobaculia bacterium]|nr:CHAT domain-containing protein [Thermoanaerobaculia bacterium]